MAHDDPPAAVPTVPTVEGLAARMSTLEKELEDARRERDEARREADATERRVVAALAGDLAGLARRARAEHAQRLGHGEGARSEQFVHQAQAFEFVAVELARKFGGEVVAAIAPPEAAPVETTAQPAAVRPEGPPAADEAPAAAPSRWGMIEVD
jgi:hypothetical protein